MVDLIINKYLETQLALAKKKHKSKHEIHDSISLKSKKVAELISKKQKSSQGNEDDCDQLEQKLCLQASTSVAKHSDEDSEYVPSCEEDEDVHTFSTASSSRTKQNIKKIIDDGDSTFYNERIVKWRNSIKSSIAGKYDGVYISADIQYILDGNKDYDITHELQNGLCVPNYIWKQLYKYQRIGVKWLWELHQIQSGGLLGDEMGLGKTVQIIAFIAGLSKTESGFWGGLGPSIIVAPATVIYQWVSHFHYWFPHLRIAVLHHSGSHSGNHNKLIREIHSSHGILLVTYAGVVRYIKDLLMKKWHYIILDEGHKIRNPDTQVSKLVKKFDTPHKLLITGSPMQNSLQELWSLFDFMTPGLLGTYTAFMDHFAVPITQGGYANATEYQEATALEIAKALKALITPYMLRRTKAEVQEHIHLPEKNEQVLFCALTKEQKDLYMGYLMTSTVRSILDKDSKYGDPLRARVLVALSTLRKICNHPDLYLYEAHEENEEIDQETFGLWKRSGKMSVVHSLLKIWLKQGHRTLIFSQSRAMLCLLEQHLQNHDFKYLKMDGSVSVSQRQSLIQTFNENAEFLVFLATTRVGGLGVNLTGADRVIIYDPDWNPATDNQAKERAWRIGQQRNVTVYRLLSAGTIEEKIYQRQIFKNFLSNKILIDPNQKNVLTTSTLQGLFTLEDLNCEGDTETASLFKHTKVSLSDKLSDKGKSNVYKSLSFSKRKLEAMRRKAKEISKKIKRDLDITSAGQEDPREKYKKKRESLLNPPKVELPEINIVDDKVTDTPFENVLSELDIVNKHTKKDYEENLLKEVLNNQDKDEEKEFEEMLNNKDEEKELKEVLNNQDKIEVMKLTIESQNIEESVIASASEQTLECVKNNNSKINKYNSRKRSHSSSDCEIENLVKVKRVKIKKQKKYKDKKCSDDDYVLSKLFAKSTVKNALHHDVVVGLAEKEKRHKIQAEAIKTAKKAVRAIKFSTK
ncbi:DNA excision repair protein ERCC-6-like [Nymphalis io]|uniref:DNA excision repair protein ERCC-6-like n=1 Tax=Inachis io TaxID=171585 RepID=UPI0021691C87|nr:DNA excision repair protein ERCC-6-like [Nymphalis io]